MTHFANGEQVIWIYEPRGGYGYTFYIPAVVVGHGRARAKIAVLHERTRQLHTRFVPETNLSRAMMTVSEKEVIAEIESKLGQAVV